MNNVKMLYYDEIDFFEGIDVNTTSESKKVPYLSLLMFFIYRVWVSIRCLRWMSGYIDDLYDPQQYCYLKH